MVQQQLTSFQNCWFSWPFWIILGLTQAQFDQKGTPIYISNLYVYFQKNGFDNGISYSNLCQIFQFLSARVPIVEICGLILRTCKLLPYSLRSIIFNIFFYPTSVVNFNYIIPGSYPIIWISFNLFPRKPSHIFRWFSCFFVKLVSFWLIREFIYFVCDWDI